MILKRLFLLCLSMALLTSCVSKITIDKTNFYKNNKIGIVIVQDSISVYKQGSQGLLDMAISSGRKYKTPLKQISPNFNPKENLLKIIEDKFTENNKNYVIINDTIDVKSFPKFDTNKSNTEENKFFKYDLRELKKKYDIDEVMLININYGLSIAYYGVIEIGRLSTTFIYTNIINLNNNQIIFRDPYKNEIPLKGKWNEPPHYENMSNHIKKSIEKALEDFSKNF